MNGCRKDFGDRLRPEERLHFNIWKDAVTKSAISHVNKALCSHHTQRLMALIKPRIERVSIPNRHCEMWMLVETGERLYAGFDVVLGEKSQGLLNGLLCQKLREEGIIGFGAAESMSNPGVMRRTEVQLHVLGSFSE